MSSKNIPKTIYDIVVTNLDGNEVKLDKFKGKCLLIVNIASDCKLMVDNVKKLRELKRKFSDDLEILLFPCNQFMGMTQKDSSEVKSFVKQEKIDFAETFSIIDVNGSEAHPLFKFLKGECSGCISWNFSKFLVSKSGHQVERFNHRILFHAIESEIKKML